MTGGPVVEKTVTTLAEMPGALRVMACGGEVVLRMPPRFALHLATVLDQLAPLAARVDAAEAKAEAWARRCADLLAAIEGHQQAVKAVARRVAVLAGLAVLPLAALSVSAVRGWL